MVKKKIVAKKNGTTSDYKKNLGWQMILKGLLMEQLLGEHLD